jgi:hypothetical protein
VRGRERPAAKAAGYVGAKPPKGGWVGRGIIEGIERRRAATEGRPYVEVLERWDYQDSWMLRAGFWGPGRS